MVKYARVGSAGIAFFVASLYGIALALLRRDRSRVPVAYAGAIARLVRPMLGLEVEYLGRENLRRQVPCVYVVNHQSAVDVPILAGIYPEETVLIAKKELRKLPLFGWLYEATGNILIDRTNNPSAVQRLREAEIAIRERRVSVWMFPEGTRGRTVGRILPFKKGAFYLAVAAEVPIVPIVISPVPPLFDPKRRVFRPGKVQVRILEPVPTRGRSEEDVPDLLDRVHRRMSEALDHLRTTPAGQQSAGLAAHPGRNRLGRG